MIKLLSMNANYIIGISIKGNINSQDFQLVENFIREVEIHYEFLRIYVEIKDISEIVLKTVCKQLELILNKFHRFEKQAIVVDKIMIPQLESLSYLFTASVKVKYFVFEDKCKAKCWILN